MPRAALEAVKFQEMPSNLQAAVMCGVGKCLEMMTQVVETAELDGGALRAGSKSVPLETLRTAQKALSDSVKKWGDGILDALQPTDPEREIPLAGDLVYTVAQAAKPKLLASFLETMTSGCMADIFAIQRFVIKSLEQFAEENRVSPGINAKIPAVRYSLLHQFLFAAACRHARVKKGLSADRLVKEEAKSMLRSNHRDSLGSLLRLYLNGLLETLPAPSELKPRVTVKECSADGMHANFARDCIARRCSFAIDGTGKLQNAQDREQEVARGRRDLEFYEKSLEEAGKDSGGKEGGDPTKWKRPVVRSSASMTQEDLQAACNAFIQAIPDLTQRLAVTTIANLGSLDLAALFFGKDPAAGILLDGTQRHMDISCSSEGLVLDISAMLFHDRLRAVERTGDFESEVDLSKSSFTQLDYTISLRTLRHQDGKNDPRWRVHKVSVEIAAPYLVPFDDPPGAETPPARQNAT